MPIHLSVQANAINWATVKFWKDYGLSRVILSRELSLDEIEEVENEFNKIVGDEDEDDTNGFTDASDAEDLFS
jgi:collagenase-like PrtC family protease